MKVLAPAPDLTPESIGETLSSDVLGMADNIVSFYDIATRTERKDGSAWYYLANDYARSLADEFNVSVERAAYVISALSPGIPWEENKADALRVFRAVQFRFGVDEFNVSTYRAQKEKAYRIARGESLDLIGKGLKTRTFAENIIRPDGRTYDNVFEQPVTVDRHAVAVAVNSVGNDHLKVSLTHKRYRNVQEAYQIAAQSISRRDNETITPSELQAIVWTVYRNRYAYRRNA